ncbi:hypothetical protein BN2364_4362 [Alloalcanivorax xenomutans]|nr:hypothetical protein BN2364_4362 [Alloalcanivorax xenomutans]
MIAMASPFAIHVLKRTPGGIKPPGEDPGIDKHRAMSC